MVKTTPKYQSDLGIIQGLLDTPTTIRSLGHCIDITNFIEAVRELRQLCANPEASCESVRKAWQRIAYELGTPVTVCLLRDLDSWLWIPYAKMDKVHRYRSHDDYTVVWVSNGEAVVGRATKKQGNVSLVFNCEKELRSC